jgi:hypothetical protein
VEFLRKKPVHNLQFPTYTSPTARQISYQSSYGKWYILFYIFISHFILFLSLLMCIMIQHFSVMTDFIFEIYSSRTMTGDSVFHIFCIQFQYKFKPNINKREPSARGYNWATLFLGDINTGTWPSRLGESQMRQ